MKLFALFAVTALIASPLGAKEADRLSDDPRGQMEGFTPKPYTTGGPLPRYCSPAEWRNAIDAAVAETKDIPLGQTAEFIRRANAVAARFGC